jgi:hypothetical protein
VVEGGKAEGDVKDNGIRSRKETYTKEVQCKRSVVRGRVVGEADIVEHSVKFGVSDVGAVEEGEEVEEGEARKELPIDCGWMGRMGGEQKVGESGNGEEGGEKDESRKRQKNG